MKRWKIKWKRSLAVMLGMVLLAAQVQLPVVAAETKEVQNVNQPENSTVSGNTPGSGVHEMTISGNDIEKVSESEKKVQTLIDALPTVEEVKAMNDEDRNTAYNKTQETYEAYETLTVEEQAQVDIAKMEVLFGYFNGQVSALGSSSTQTETSVAVVNGVYYDNLKEALEASCDDWGDLIGECVLLKDVTLTEDISGIEFCLNLNGNTIKGDKTLTIMYTSESYIKGPGIIEGNLFVMNSKGIYAPLTVNGDVTSDTYIPLRIYGDGLFEVNGNVSSGSSTGLIELKGNIKLYCNGTLSGTVDGEGNVIKTPFVTNVTVDSQNATLDIDNTLDLKATITPDNAYDKTVNWSSSDTNVATVDSTGKVTAVGQGQATITATAVNCKENNITATCTVTVNAPNYTVTVTDGTGDGEYKEGENVTITADAPESGKQFKEWTGVDGLTFTDGTSKTSATAKFTMPANAVTVTATYEDIPKETVPTATINYLTEKLQGLTAGIRYTVNGTEYTADNNGNIDIESSWIGTTIEIIKIASDASHVNSEAQNLVIPARLEVQNVQGVNTSYADTKDGKITGVTAVMEYRKGTSGSWVSCIGTEVTGLEAGTYEVRVKATSSNFAGKTATVTIATGAERTYTLNVAAPAFDNVTEGYIQPEAKALTITSSGNSDAAITGVTVDSINFTITEGTPSVTAGDKNETYKIQPIAGLSAGTYKGTITVTYNNGATATAEVSFTVDSKDYTVTVTDGTGAGEYKEGETVTITADAPESGKQFKEWTGVDGLTFTDGTSKTSATAKFTMPANAVNVTATYEDIPKEAVPTATINYLTEKLQGLTADAKYTVNDTEYTADNSGNIDIESSWIGTTIAIIKIASDANHVNSEAQNLVIPARLEVQNVQGVNTSYADTKDGKITGVTAAMEYRKGTSGTWTSCTGTEVTGLEAGTYEVRVKATSSNFAGKTATVTIGTGAERTYTLNVAAPAFDNVTEGYAQPEAKQITITSSGNSDAAITDVTVDSTNFTITAGTPSVTAGGQNDTYKIQPIADLIAGTYKGTITVTYNNGATATAEVSFTVTKEEKPPHTHSYTSSVTKQPTCTQDGEKTYRCSCGDFYIEKIKAAGHTVSDWIVDRQPTEDAEGTQYKECTVCHTILEQETLVKLPPSSEEKEEPFIKGEDGKEGTATESGWDAITDKTETAKDGDKITVDMNGATVIPGDVIESIAGKDVTIVFDMGDGITWTVNGKSVTADNIADINLNVSKDTTNIPVDVINNVTGERYAMTISIDYEGEFGFTAILTVNMDKKNAGLYANLFYYNRKAENGKGALEFMCADKIDANGNADLAFTHASDYTIVIDKDSMEPRESNKKDSNKNPNNQNNQTTEQASPKTGESELALLLFGALLITAAGVSAKVRRQRTILKK